MGGFVTTLEHILDKLIKDKAQFRRETARFAERARFRQRFHGRQFRDTKPKCPKTLFICFSNVALISHLCRISNWKEMYHEVYAGAIDEMEKCLDELINIHNSRIHELKKLELPDELINLLSEFAEGEAYASEGDAAKEIMRRLERNMTRKGALRDWIQSKVNTILEL